MVENFTAGCKVAQHFLETGCEDFSTLAWTTLLMTTASHGFSFELKEHGFDLTKSRIHRLRHRNGQLNLTCSRPSIVAAAPEVFCYHDLSPCGAIRGARLCNYRIPRTSPSLALMTFQSPRKCSLLSSVAYPLNQIVENALRILLDRILRPYNREPEVCSLNARLIVRESSSLSLHPPGGGGHAAAKLS